MSAKRRARNTLVVVVALAVPLAIASMAFACARLATLKLDRSGGRPGVAVDAVGRNFSNDPSSSPVALRFNSRNGRVLWQGRADRQGRISGSFAIPNARPGHYVIVATQQTAEGRPAAGTPGRAPLAVRQGASSAAAAGAPMPPAAGSPGGGLPAAPIALIPLLLLVLGAGAGGLATMGRRRNGSTPART